MRVVIALITLLGLLLFENPLIGRAPMIQNTFEIGPVDLKARVYDILRYKCNSCHKKQNPFMIFSEKNMVKRAEKIYQQVIILKRMPKEGKLTKEEYDLIKKWLLTEINH